MNNKPDALWEHAKEIADRTGYNLNFSTDTLSDGTLVHVVEVAELLGCIAYGESVPQAVANVGEAIAEYVYSLLVDDLPIPGPDPSLVYSFSGVGHGTTQWNSTELSTDKRTGVVSLSGALKLVPA